MIHAPDLIPEDLRPQLFEFVKTLRSLTLSSAYEKLHSWLLARKICLTVDDTLTVLSFCRHEIGEPY